MRTRQILVTLLVVLVTACGMVSAGEQPASPADNSIPNLQYPDPSIPPAGWDAAIPGGASDGAASLSAGSQKRENYGTTADIGRIYYAFIFPQVDIRLGQHPAVVSRSPNLMDMVVVDREGYINWTYGTILDFPDWTPGTRVTAGNYTRFSPAIGSAGPDHLALFFVNGDGGLYERDWTGGSWGPWSSDLSMGYDANSTPAVTSRSAGTLELVYRNRTGLLIHRTKSGGTWGEPDIIGPRMISNEGVSIVSAKPESFLIVLHHPYNNTIWTLEWEGPMETYDPTLPGYVDSRWVATSIPAFAFAGASTRSYTDAQGNATCIDIVYPINTVPEYYWNVSRDGGITWQPESWNQQYQGTGYLDYSGASFVVVSPRYNRLVFVQEYLETIFAHVYKAPAHERIGVFRDGSWALDEDNSFTWNAPDRSYLYGVAGTSPVTGDWNGDGTTETGAFSSGVWYLDFNGNGLYDDLGLDRQYAFGSDGDVPVSGDWDSDGRDEIGVEKDGFWAIDYNGNGTWDGDGIDRFAAFGQAGDIPVTGDWNGDGKIEIGVEKDGFWAIDYNGNFKWSGAISDRFAGFGMEGDRPVTGDWDADGRAEIGVEKDGFWAIDYNGNFTWDGTTDDRFAGFGQEDDIPVAADWNGDGRTEIASFMKGFWAVDYNGNYAWDGVIDDRFAMFGSAGAVPVAGAWS